MFEKASEFYNRLSVRQRRWLIVTLFLALQATLWLLLELLYYHSRPITDTSIYYQYSSRMVNGYFPYDDFSAEYPPVAMLIFLLPRLISGSSYNFFVYWFELEMFLFGCGNILLLAYIVWKRWRDIGRLVTALGLYTLFTVMMGFIIAARFDVVAGFLILAVVAACISDRKIVAWTLIGIGIMTKVVPLLIAPLLLIAHLHRKEREWLFVGPVIALVAATALALPFLAASPEGLARAFLYHAERPLQIESSWSSPILIMHFFGYGIRMFSSYGSHNLFTPLSNILATISAPVTLVFLGMGYWFFWKRISSRKAADNEGYFSDQLVRYSALTVVIFIAGGKVLSPQFLIWLLPLMPLIYDRDRNYLLTVFGTILILTQLEFPFFYGDLLGLNPFMIILVTVRNALLIWLAVTLMRKPVPRDGIFGMYKLSETETG